MDIRFEIAGALQNLDRIHDHHTRDSLKTALDDVLRDENANAADVRYVVRLIEQRLSEQEA